MAVEATEMIPVEQVNSPKIVLSKLDFPDPTGPSSMVNEPSSIVKLASMIAATFASGAGKIVALSTEIADGNIGEAPPFSYEFTSFSENT